MNSKELCDLITAGLVHHRLRTGVQLFHGLKDILESTGKPPTPVPNFDTLLEYCTITLKSSIAEKVTLVCDPVTACILKMQFQECITLSPDIEDRIRIVTEHLIFQSAVIYVLAERRNEETLGLVDYTPTTILDYSAVREQYYPAVKSNIKLPLGGKSNG